MIVLVLVNLVCIHFVEYLSIFDVSSTGGFNPIYGCGHVWDDGVR